MPVVPYNRGQPAVQPQALRTGQLSGVSPSAGTSGARQMRQMGQQISDIGGELNRVAVQQQNDRNASKVLAAKTAFDAEAATVLTDARNQRGMNAWGITKKTNEWYKSASQKHLDGLENEAQRKAMQGVFAQKWPAIKANIYSHEVAEQRSAVNESAKASIQSAVDFGIANRDDPNLLAQSTADISRVVRAQQAVNEGWDEETTQAALQSHLTALHKGVIEAKLDEDPRAAEAYYEVNKDQIRGIEQPVIEAKLAVGRQLVEAQTFVDEQEAQGATEEEQLAQARDRYEGEQEEEVIAEITRRASQREAAIRRGQDEAYREADAKLMEGATYDQLPPSLLAKLDRDDRAKLRKGQYGQVTDWDTYYGLRQLAAQDPEAFRRMDLTRYFGDLDASKRTEIVKLQTKAQKDPESLTLGRTKWQVMQQAAAKAGLDPSKQSKEGGEGDKVRAFYRRIDDEILQFYNEQGREPGRKELLDITDRLNREIVMSDAGWFWFDAEQPAAIVEVEGVPTDMVDELAETVEAEGAPVTEDNIRKLYNYLLDRGVQ